jgi:Methyltransferase domain
VITTFIESLSLAYGHWLWTRNPDYAKKMLFKGTLGFHGGAIRRYFVKVLEPNLAVSEVAGTVYDSHCQRLVEPTDFLSIKSVFNLHGYEENGILPLESVVLWALIRHYRPEVVLESGTYRGQSAVVLCEALAHNDGFREFHSISPNEHNTHEVARQRLGGFPFARIHEGFSEIILPKLLEMSRDKSVALFLDGPKAQDGAFTDVLDKIDDPTRVSFVAVHDCEWSPPSPGMTFASVKIERLRLTDWYSRSELRHTHELWFMDNAWCERNHQAWVNLPTNPPGGVKPHHFGHSNQFSPTPMLGVISRR